MYLAAGVPFFFNCIFEVSRYISPHYKRCDTSVASLAKKICVLEQRKSVKGLPGVLALIIFVARLMAKFSRHVSNFPAEGEARVQQR